MITDPPWQTLDLAQASKLPEPATGKAIYFLWRDDAAANETELLYVGASTQVSERIARQRQFRDFGQFGSNTTAAKPRIPFTRATALPCRTVREMADIEKVLIRRFQPPWNDRVDDGDQVWARQLADEEKDARATLNGTAD